MNQARVKDLIAALDSEVPREGARVRLHQYGGGPDESQVQANSAGYLRLGIEFLKAAYRESDPKSPQAVEVDLDYMLLPTSTIHFGWFERSEEISGSTGEASLSGFDRLVPSLILSVLVAVVLLAIVGLVSVIRWLL